jgi:D-alanyl-D-alanine carboxypeptidase
MSGRAAPRRARPAPAAPRRSDGWLAIAVVDGWLACQRATRRIPALSIGVVHGDAVVFSRGYGYADETARRRATDATGDRIASISKVFTATAVMQLVERNAVRLDERVERYVPWIRARSGTA